MVYHPGNREAIEVSELRWYLIGPLLFFAFIAFITWHILFAGGCLVMAGIIWELSDNKHQERLLREIERYANDGDNS